METGNADIVGATMEKSLLSLRVMRKLTIHGFKNPHQSNPAMEFVQSLYERIKHLLQYRKKRDFFQLQLNLTMTFVQVKWLFRTLIC